MEPGRFRHRVTIQNFVTTRSPSGQPVQEWISIDTVSAEVKGISGREFMSSGAELGEATVRIWMRYRADVKATSRLLFRSEVYEIKAPPIPDAKFSRLEILCGSGVKQ